jgi:hypothetical protein
VRVQVEVIRLLVSNYFDIVRNNLADLVPKALMRFLVHHSQRGLQQHLIATLYRCVWHRIFLCSVQLGAPQPARPAAAPHCSTLQVHFAQGWRRR